MKISTLLFISRKASETLQLGLAVGLFCIAARALHAYTPSNPAAQTFFGATSADNASRKGSAMPTETKFYCNTKALDPVARTRHTQLTAKLLAARKQIVESEKGYEFQFSPTDVSLSELADWTTAEAKCCPFFDFHLDLEVHGTLLCLRLTGPSGIKPFIQAEFQVPIT